MTTAHRYQTTDEAIASPGLDAQQYFDVVAQHLRDQGQQSLAPGEYGGTCAYYTESEKGEPLCCAIGHLIPADNQLAALDLTVTDLIRDESAVGNFYGWANNTVADVDLDDDDIARFVLPRGVSIERAIGLATDLQQVHDANLCWEHENGVDRFAGESRLARVASKYDLEYTGPTA